jgi:hypothetical protein
MQSYLIFAEGGERFLNLLIGETQERIFRVERRDLGFIGRCFRFFVATHDDLLFGRSIQFAEATCNLATYVHVCHVSERRVLCVFDAAKAVMTTPHFREGETRCTHTLTPNFQYLDMFSTFPPAKTKVCIPPVGARIETLDLN